MPRLSVSPDCNTDLARVVDLIEDASTVFWDFDGVVADTEPMQAQTFVDVLTELGYEPTTEFFLEFVGRPEAETWSTLIDRLRLPDSVDSLTARRSDLYLARAATVRAAWYVPELLERARQTGSTCVIVSSGNFHHITALLEQMGLSDHFVEISAFIGSDGARGTSKALRLEQLADVYPGPHVLIDDSVTYVDHGRTLGMQTVLVRHGMSVESDKSSSGPVLWH